MNVRTLLQSVFKKTAFLWPEEVLKKRISRKKGTVVLMYHSVSNKESAYPYHISLDEFSEQITVINELFVPVTPEQLEEMLSGKKVPNSEKPCILITFDDGYKNNKTKALPVLKGHNIPVILFLTTTFIDNPGSTFLTWEDVRNFADEPLVYVGSHTMHHANLQALEKNDQEKEIIGSKKRISEVLEKPVQFFSYPGGAYDEHALSLAESEYLLAFADRVNKNTLRERRAVARVSIDKKNSSRKQFLFELAFVPYLK